MWEDNDPTPSPADGEVKADPTPEKGGGKGADAKADKVELSRKDYEALLAEREEARKSEKFWADKARSTRTPTPEPDPEPEEDDDDGDDPDLSDDTPEKFTDDLSARGIAALEKRGVITRRQAREMLERREERLLREVDKRVEAKISGAQRQMVQDAEMLKSYPDLSDPKSELFLKTKEIFGEMVESDPSLKRSPGALQAAARAAKAELGTKARAERETERERRVRDQAGDRGDFGTDDEGDTLSPMQRKILDKLNSDGGPQISEDAYRKRAKSGTNMASKGYAPGTMKW